VPKPKHAPPRQRHKPPRHQAAYKQYPRAIAIFTMTSNIARAVVWVFVTGSHQVVSLSTVFAIVWSPTCQGRPAGSGLATAARREPGLPGPPRRPAPTCALRYPWPACLPPPCPDWPTQLAQLAPCGAGPKQRGQGRAGRWPVATWPGTETRKSQVAACHTAPALPLPRCPLRREPPAPPASHPHPRSKRSRRLAAPKPVVVTSSDRRGFGGNGLLILATS
jgi:hypothetical protein